MPIKPENKALYPPDWDEISYRIRFVRAGGRCERCGAVHNSFVNKDTREICLRDEDGAIRIILTCAHKDHNPANCSEDNLAAWCQKCHNEYDSPMRRKHAAETRELKRGVGNLKLTF